MISPWSYAPAKLYTVIFMDNSVFAGFLFQTALGVPFAVVLELLSIGHHTEIVNGNVAQILPNQIPFGDIVAGGNIPSLVNQCAAVLLQVHYHVQFAHALTIGPSR